MKLASTLTAAGLIFATLAGAPAVADPGHGKGHGKAHARHAERHEHRDRHDAHCPPGLAKKGPRCIPPGHARKHDHHRHHVGDVLRRGDYAIIRDPRRYDLEDRRGWDYYRDDNSIYRVDSNTQKILAVINLINAFSN